MKSKNFKTQRDMRVRKKTKTFKPKPFKGTTLGEIFKELKKKNEK